MVYKNLKKETRWFWKTDLGRSKKQEKYLEDKLLAISTGEKK